MTVHVTLAAVVALVVGVLIGVGLTLDNLQKDCAVLGKTRINETVIGCVVKP